MAEARKNSPPRADGAADPDPGSLARWLAARLPGFRPPLEIVRLEGGQSNPTYRLATGGGDYVLRRKPPGRLLPGAHAVEREFRVTAALDEAGFPVPRPLALCEDEGVIGTPFYVMEMVAGRIVWDPAFPELPAPARAAHFDAMNAAIARLHRFDPHALGLGDFGRPGNYCARQIERWSGQYLADEAAGRIAAMDRLIGWLRANIPDEEGERPRIVHGDFRCDNMIFAPDRPEILAVIDWELATLGHPLADFAYHLLMYRMPRGLMRGLAGRDLKGLGIPAEEEYVAAYCARTGRERIAGLDFYIAFTMFRIAAIVHGIRGRIARGTAASPKAGELAGRLEEIAALGLAQAERAGARG